MSACPPGAKRRLGLLSLALLSACVPEQPVAVTASLAVLPLPERIVMAPVLPDRMTALTLPDLNTAPERRVVELPPAPVTRLAEMSAPTAAPPAPIIPPREAAQPRADPPIETAPPPSVPAPLERPLAIAAPPPTRTEPPAASRDGVRVQLAAAGSTAEAMRHWAHVQQQAPELTQGLSPSVVTLERPEQPTIWRLRVGGFTTPETAQRWCDALREHRLSCWVSG